MHYFCACNHRSVDFIYKLHPFSKTQNSDRNFHKKKKNMFERQRQVTCIFNVARQPEEKCVTDKLGKKQTE